MNRVAAFTQYLVTKRSFSMMPIFNRGIKRHQHRLVDRLEDIEREFPLALDLGCGSGHLYKNLGVQSRS
ncbi:unnamed protein product [Peronospora destructor]|uniref:Methyltransferase type 11 domain-containing protein n=1 Tax=Peronospora destructor TaxID=86335 RepID=A0AAV0V7N8_9STRA|nr:unnamed protein product [Peronospora destructor]